MISIVRWNLRLVIFGVEGVLDRLCLRRLNRAIVVQECLEPRKQARSKSVIEAAVLDLMLSRD